MALVKGPFSIKWGANPVVDVTEIGFEYDIESNEYQTIDGRTLSVEGAMTASVELTLLSSDVATLQALLPQYHKKNGERLSTGETVNDEAGAIDFVAASCDTRTTTNHLEIKACGDNGEVMRLVNARPVLSGMEFADNAVRQITLTFKGEPTQGQGLVQFFKNNKIAA